MTRARLLRIAQVVWRVVSRMAVIWGIWLALLAGLNWGLTHLALRDWTRGLIIGIMAVTLGEMGERIELWWIHSSTPPRAPRPQLPVDPRVLVAARAMCNQPPDERPCESCLAQTRRVLWAYQSAPDVGAVKDVP